MAGPAFGQPAYDLLLQGGHVIDAKNNISAVRDVAIKDGTIAAVAEHLDPGRRFEGGQRRGTLRHARAGGYPRPRLHGHRGARLLCRRSQPLPGRLHVSRGRDDGGGRRLRRLAQFRRLQGPHHRSLQDPRAGVPQYCGQRHARRQVRERSRQTWRPRPPPRWRCATRA